MDSMPKISDEMILLMIRYAGPDFGNKGMMIILTEWNSFLCIVYRPTLQMQNVPFSYSILNNHCFTLFI